MSELFNIADDNTLEMEIYVPVMKIGQGYESMENKICQKQIININRSTRRLSPVVTIIESYMGM